MKWDKTIELKTLGEKQVSSKRIYDGHVVHLDVDTIILPNGNYGTREIIRHVGAVCMLAITQEGKVVVERQYRYPNNQIFTEIPAGKLDSKKEDPLEAAKRELREECGLIANNWVEMGTYHPTVAYTDEIIHMYLCTDLAKTKRELDEDEFLDVYEIPLDELVDMVMNGEIIDGKSQVIILKVNEFLKRNL